MISATSRSITRSGMRALIVMLTSPPTRAVTRACDASYLGCLNLAKPTAGGKKPFSALSVNPRAERARLSP